MRFLDCLVLVELNGVIQTSCFNSMRGSHNVFIIVAHDFRIKCWGLNLGGWQWVLQNSVLLMGCLDCFEDMIVLWSFDAVYIRIWLWKVIFLLFDWLGVQNNRGLELRFEIWLLRFQLAIDKVFLLNGCFYLLGGDRLHLRDFNWIRGFRVLKLLDWGVFLHIVTYVVRLIPLFI